MTSETRRLHERRPELLEGAAQMRGASVRGAGRHVMYAREQDAKVEQVEERFDAVPKEHERDLAGAAGARVHVPTLCAELEDF